MTGEGLASSASLVRGVLPNRQVPTPSGEGNVMADATQREPVRGPEPVAKRASMPSGFRPGQHHLMVLDAACGTHASAPDGCEDSGV